MKTRVRLMVLLALVFGLGSGIAFGQSITGSITGSVLDANGGAILGADVTATNTATGIEYKSTTVAAGFYTISYLPGGTYTVTVQFKGFKTGVASNEIVEVGESTRADFTLSPGEISDKVEVTAEAPLVQTTTSSINTVITSNQVTTLPFDGRLFQSVVFLVPGATPQAWGDQNESAPR